MPATGSTRSERWWWWATTSTRASCDKASPGFHYFRKGPGGQAELVRVDYAPGGLRALARHSRLALYLVNNLGVGSLAQRLGAARAGKGAFVGQTAAAADRDRLEGSLFAIDTFVELLPGAFGLPPERILLVLDAPRPDLMIPRRLRGRAQATSRTCGRL